LTEKEVYQFYNSIFKIAYSEIEAAGNNLPAELLFEIHAAFDHLKRFHIDGEDEAICCDKAFSHLKRAALDAYKLKLKYFHKNYDKVFGRNLGDLRLVDNGAFLPNALKVRRRIIETAQNARLAEGQKDIASAFSGWQEVSILIKEFEDGFFDSEKIQWARANSLRQSFIGGVIGFVVGIASSVIAGLLTDLPCIFSF
jgi:hypothetical protein